MPKIQRKTQKIFCGNADNDQLAVFGSMATGTPVYTNDIEELQENEAYSEGWEAATLEDKAPFMEEMNGLQYGLSKQIAYTLQEGIPEYDANTTYYIGSIVKALNEGKPVLYSSLIDNNIGNALTDATAWEELSFGGGDINDKITNCILAMYGITYSGNTFTVKAGTKALISNGFNVDRTYNNIEWTAQNDIIQTVDLYDDATYLIYRADANLLVHSNFLGSFAEAPALGGSWGSYYNTTENCFYLSGVSEWYKAPLVFLAELTATDETITTFNVKEPIKLADTTQVDGQWVKKYALIAESLNLPVTTQETSIEYDLSEYLPNDGYNYEVLVNCNVSTGATSGSYINASLGGWGTQNQVKIWVRVIGITTRTSSAMDMFNNGVVPIGKNRKMAFSYNVGRSAGNLQMMNLEGYRRLGTNQ